MNLSGKKINLLLAVLLAAGCSSCNRGQQSKRAEQATHDQRSHEYREALIHQNKQLILEEIDLIDAYASRYGLQFDTTSTGLRYKILEKTNGRVAGLMKDITISYTAGLLDGSQCYSSDSTGNLTFTLGQSDQPSGLQEGILKLKEGEAALLIVPSFLAYGISGDGVCIPGSSSIVYKIKLLKVSEQ